TPCRSRRCTRRGWSRTTARPSPRTRTCSRSTAPRSRLAWCGRRSAGHGEAVERLVEARRGGVCLAPALAALRRLGVGDEHRDRAVAQDVLADAAEERRAHGAAAPRAHHHQVVVA